MNIVVFGGSGFIGSHVVDELIDSGHNVINFDCQARKNDPSKYIQGNILNLDEVLDATKKANVVYNFAGRAELNIEPEISIKYNIIGNENILCACMQNNAKYIYASTLYVGSNKGGFYRCSKQAAESYIEEYHRQYGLNYTILRYGTVYGPRAGPTNSIRKYIEEALKTGQITATDDLNCLREYIHVTDTAKMSVQAMDKKYNNKKLIISGQHLMTYQQMLNMISEIIGNVKVTFNNEETSNDHYSYTPYTISERPEKLIPNSYVDMGQGLLECIEEIKNDEKLSNTTKPMA